MATQDEYDVVANHVGQLIWADEQKVPTPLRKLIPQDEVLKFVNDVAHLSVDTLDIYRAKKAAGEPMPVPHLMSEVVEGAALKEDEDEGKRRKRG